MERVPEVKTGFWVNHEASPFKKLQWTTTDGYNAALQVAIGYFLGLMTPWVDVILVRSYHWCLYYHRRQSRTSKRPSRTNSHLDEAAHLLRPSEGLASADYIDPRQQQDEADLGPGSAIVLYGSNEPEPQPAITASSTSQHDSDSDVSLHDQNNTTKNEKLTSRINVSGILSACLVLVAIALTIAASFATTIPTDTYGLSASRFCGSWGLDEDAGSKAKDKDDLLLTQKETRAGQYARDCYGQRSVVNPDRCSFFNEQTIPYHEPQLYQRCPFKDLNICDGGGYTAVRFTTGLVDASLLGVNAVNTPKFNRTTICAPLNLDQGFVKEFPPDDDHGQYRWEYNLGGVKGPTYSSNSTFTMFGDPFEWEVPAYAVSAYEATPYEKNSYWTPAKELDILPELDTLHPGQIYTTLMFISSCRIFYTGGSNDYIFPADQDPVYCPGFYCNTDPRARALVCIDWNEVCTHDGKNCDSMTQDDHTEWGREYEFTRSALRQSTTMQAIRFRLGGALMAQESVGDFESRKLPDDQWIVEAESLWNTSLARIQYDALDIATNVGHEEPSYVPKNPDWAQGRKLCEMYKFQLPKGYTNINVILTLIVVAIVPTVYGLSRQTSVTFDEKRKSAFKGNWMVFDLVAWAVKHPQRCWRGRWPSKSNA